MTTARRSTRVLPHVASPIAVPVNRVHQGSTSSASSLTPRSSTEFPRSWEKRTVEQVGAEGHYYLIDDGRKILDVSGGAAVSCFGPGYNERIADAMNKAFVRFGGYSCSSSFTNRATQNFIDALVESTEGHMESALLYGSGSDTAEAAYKLLLQYFAEKNQPERTVIIARETSYHGTTFGALSMGSYCSRRKPFEDVLMQVPRVSACNPYRNKRAEETDQHYVARLKAELKQKFLDVGPERIAGFFCEPVVGAALGCMPPVPGYLQAVREVCDDYGVPLVFDEIMCGWGRCGTLHAWQTYGVVPDIQLLGKGLVGGYDMLSAVLVGKKLGFMDAIREGSGYFNHGHTFQGMPKSCAGALETMKMVIEQLPNVKAMGERLMKGLQARLEIHPHVGDVRGGGLFIGIEFVQDKLSKSAFNPADRLASRIQELGCTDPHNIHVYTGAGSANPVGMEGDHIIIAPPYDVDAAEVDDIINKVVDLINTFFAEYMPATP